MTTKLKTPDGVIDHTFSWATWLGGDTITTSTMTADTGITVDSDSNDTTSATVWLSGGSLGQTYDIVNQVVTNAGRTEEMTLTIRMVPDKSA